MRESPDLSFLEPGQRASDSLAPLPRRRLGRGAVALLWVMRIYVLIAIPLVGYAFVRALMRG